LLLLLLLLLHELEVQLQLQLQIQVQVQSKSNPTSDGPAFAFLPSRALGKKLQWQARPLQTSLSSVPLLTSSNQNSLLYSICSLHLQDTQQCSTAVRARNSSRYSTPQVQPESCPSSAPFQSNRITTLLTFVIPLFRPSM
jgi:hypothetical protein